MGRALTKSILLGAAVICSRIALSCGDGALGPIECALRVTPESADFVVVVDDASAHLGGEAGAALRGMAGSALARSELPRAWSSLSARLGMGEREAFDALLGRRVVFAMARGKDGEESRGWVALSWVRMDAAARLKKRLDVAPRKLAAGGAVFSVENGRYELTMTRREDWAVVALGPSSSPALLESATMSLALERDGGGVCAHREGDLLVRARGPQQEEMWVELLASLEGVELEGEVSAAIPDGDELVEPLRVWKRSTWAALAEGALAAFIEWAPARRGEGSIVADLLRETGLLELGDEAGALLGQRVALAAYPAEGGGVHLAAGIESVDVGALAEAGDAAMSEMLAWLGVGEVDLGGLDWRAARVVNAEGSGPLRALTPQERAALWAVWSFSGGTDAMEAPEGAGWWIVGTSRDAHERATAALTDDSRVDEARPWHSLGMVRPAAILAALREGGLSLPPEAGAAAWVEDLGWATEACGAVERGRLRVRLAGKAE